jgi:hypothetical protein
MGAVVTEEWFARRPERSSERLACPYCDATGHRCDFCDGDGSMLAEDAPAQPHNLEWSYQL